MAGRRSISMFVATALAACIAVGAAHAVSAGVAIVVATALALPALAWFGCQAYQHQKVGVALRRHSEPSMLADTPVRLLPADRSAFVSGLWRPHIYCSRHLDVTLTDDELRAVLLHERAHQRSRDPLRLLLVGSVTPLARLHRRGRVWLERVAAMREVAADRYALEHGASRRALASALLKLEPVPSGPLAGFATAAELRVRALLADDPAVVFRPARIRWVLMGGAAAAGYCLSMWRPLVEALCCP